MSSLLHHPLYGGSSIIQLLCHVSVGICLYSPILMFVEVEVAHLVALLCIHLKLFAICY